MLPCNRSEWRHYSQITHSGTTAYFRPLFSLYHIVFIRLVISVQMVCIILTVFIRNQLSV